MHGVTCIHSAGNAGGWCTLQVEFPSQPGKNMFLSCLRVADVSFGVVHVLLRCSYLKQTGCFTAQLGMLVGFLMYPIVLPGWVSPHPRRMQHWCVASHRPRRSFLFRTPSRRCRPVFVPRSIAASRVRMRLAGQKLVVYCHWLQEPWVCVPFCCYVAV